MPGSNGTTATNELDRKVAVVTGSSSGIGRAIALELAGAGADVIVHARSNRSGADATRQKIEELGRRSHVLLADFGDAATHETFVEQAWCWRDGVDIWINNAGADVLTGTNALMSFEDKLALLWRVDVMSTIRLSRIVGNRMQQRDCEPGESVVLNLGWDQAEFGMAGESGEMFAAIKGAIMAFSKSLAHSLAPHVRVNCLAPGWIKTSWGDEATEYWQQRARSEALLDRWGTAEDVARAAKFLTSPAGSFITGQIIPVNGGLRRSQRD